MSTTPGVNLLTPRRTLLAVVLLLLSFVGLAVTSLRSKSVTTDEIVYITAGYYHLTTGRFDFNGTNPPLMKVIAALPLLFVRPELPDMAGNPAEWDEVQQWQYARRFLYSNSVDAEVILTLARLPIVMLGVLLGVLIFVWSRRLYGDRSALLALTLYAFSPNILAHTRLATQDLGLALMFTWALYALWRHSLAPSRKTATWFGIAVGLAVLTKTTALFLMPIAVIFAAIEVFRPGETGIWRDAPLVHATESTRGKKLLSYAWLFVVACVLGLIVLQLGYLFENTFQPIARYVHRERMLTRLHADFEPLRTIAGGLLAIPVPLPGPFVELLKFQLNRIATGNHMFFAGELSQTGWWYLTPFAFLVKTPIPALCLAGAALYGFSRRGSRTSAEWLLWIGSAFLLALFSYLKSVSVGLRYLLPLFPLLHILASKIATWKFEHRLAKPALAVLLTWYVAGTACLHPHYLAYFNELVGGPKNGYHYLVDSHLDWGQDLATLKDYMDEKGIEKIRLAYFGSADARYYGIDYEYLPSVGLAPPKTGHWWYERQRALPELVLDGPPIAISASLLAGIFYPDYYKPLQRLKPVAEIGHSILIFDPSHEIQD